MSYQSREQMSTERAASASASAAAAAAEARAGRCRTATVPSEEAEAKYSACSSKHRSVTSRECSFRTLTCVQQRGACVGEHSMRALAEPRRQRRRQGLHCRWCLPAAAARPPTSPSPPDCLDGPAAAPIRPGGPLPAPCPRRKTRLQGQHRLLLLEETRRLAGCT